MIWRLRILAVYGGQPPCLAWLTVTVGGLVVSAVAAELVGRAAGGTYGTAVAVAGAAVSVSCGAVAATLRVLFDQVCADHRVQARMLADTAAWRPQLLDKMHRRIRWNSNRDWNHAYDGFVLDLARDWAGGPGHTRHGIAELIVALGDDHLVHDLFSRQLACAPPNPDGGSGHAGTLTAITEAVAGLDHSGRRIARRLLDDDPNTPGVAIAQAAAVLGGPRADT